MLYMAREPVWQPAGVQWAVRDWQGAPLPHIKPAVWHKLWCLIALNSEVSAVHLVLA